MEITISIDKKGLSKIAAYTTVLAFIAFYYFFGPQLQLIFAATNIGVTVYINGSTSDQSMTYGTVANLTVEANISTSPNNVCLFVNSSAYLSSQCYPTYVININSTSRTIAAKVYNVTGSWGGNATQPATSDISYLTVTQASPSLVVAPLAAATYPTATQTGCQRVTGDTGATLTLFRNGTQVATGTTATINETSITLGAGVYNYTCTYTASTNYTAGSSLNNYRTVAQNTTNLVDVYLANSTNAYKNQNITIANNAQITANATMVYSNAGTASLYEDGVAVSNPRSATLSAGTHPYKANVTGNANYSTNATGATYYVTVSDVIPPLWQNPGTNDTDNIINQGEAINLTAQGKDETALKWAWLATNETGQWKNYADVGLPNTVATSTSVSSLAWGGMTKTHYDSVNSLYVQAYYNGTAGTYYLRMSSDGTTWTNTPQSLSTPSTRIVSFAFVNNIVHYVYGDYASRADDGSLTVHLHYRRATINSATSITLDAERTIQTWTQSCDLTGNSAYSFILDMRYYDISIGTDNLITVVWARNGYAYSYFYNIEFEDYLYASRYVYNVIKSTATDGSTWGSITTKESANSYWTDDTTTVVGDSTGSTAQYSVDTRPRLAPLASTVMICFDNKDGVGRYSLSSGWTTHTNFDATIKDVNGWGSVAVGDGGGKVGLAYVDSDDTVDAAWYNGTTLTTDADVFAATVSSPTITSVNETNGDWYAFVISGTSIVYKKCSQYDGTWDSSATTFASSLTSPADLSSSRTFLNSRVLVSYQTGSASPYNVIFQEIKYTYNSPMDMQDVANTWTWSNFTWSNSSVAQGATVGWRIYYNDTSGNNNGTGIMTFTIRDSTPPQWSSNATNITATYSPTTSSQFNITWTDNIAVDKVFIEGNWSGSPYNYTPSVDGNVRYLTTILPAGTHYWRSFANDTSNNWNVSNTWYFTVAKASRTCTLSTDKGWTRNYDGTTSSTTCTVSIASTDGTMTFTRDSVSKTSPDAVTNAGAYAYACQWGVGVNYSACTQQTNTLTINRIDPTLSIGSLASVNFGTATTTGCEVKTGDAGATITLYRNSTQVATGTTTTINETSVTLGVGVWNYTCTYAQTANYNAFTLANQYRTVNAVAPTIFVAPLATVTYPTATQTGCQKVSGDPSGNISLYRNGTLVNSSITLSFVNETSITLGAGVYNYTCTYNGTTNYTAGSSANNYRTVSQATRTCTLSTDKGWTRNYDGTASSTTCTVSAGSTDGSMTFTRDSVGKTSPDLVTNAGAYAYACQWGAGVNYSACSQQTNTLTINRIDPTLSIGSLASVNFGTATTTGCELKTGDAGATITLFRNKSQVATGATATINETSVVLGGGKWNYTCSYAQSTNYNAYSLLDQYRTINPIAPSLSIGSLAAVNYGTATTTGCERIAGDPGANLYLFRNGTQVASGATATINETSIVLGANVYNYTCNYTATQNYSSAWLLSQYRTVNTIASTIFVAPLASVNYGTATQTGCQKTAGDPSGVITLLRNGTQVATGITTTINETSIVLGANVHNYTCNYTATQNYTTTNSVNNYLTVNQNNTNPVNLYFNGTANANRTYTYPQVVNATGVAVYSGSGTIFLYRGNVQKASGTSPQTEQILLGNETYAYKVNITGNANYSSNATGATYYVFVNKGVVYPDLFVNGTATWTYQYPNVTNVTCNITQVDGGSGPSCSLWRDDVSKGTSEVTRLPNGTYVYRANATGTANYSANATGQTHNLTITLGAAPTVTVTFDRTSGRNYTAGNNLGIQCDVTSGENSIMQILRNNTVVKQTTSNATQLTYNDSIGVGVWNYSCYYIASQNYTAASSIDNNYVVYKNVPILTMSNNTATVNTSGLVGYWRFENESLGTAMDYSGWGNNGTLTSMNNTGNATSGPTTAGRFGSAMQFDGVNDYVNISNSDSINFYNTSSYTISAWVNIPAIPVPIDKSIMEKWAGSGTYPYVIRTESNTGRVYFAIWDGSNNPTAISTVGTRFNDSQWHHIVGVRSFADDKLYLFIDGKLNSSATDTTTANINNTVNLFIGSRGTTANTYFNGTIDEVQIFNRSLTADEIKELYESRVQYPTQTMFNATESNSGDADVTYGLYRNTTLVTSTENGTAMRLPAGYHYYIFNATAGTNYTTASLLLPLNVTKGLLYPDTFVNSTATWSYAYPNATNVTCNITQVDGGSGPSCLLWRDDVSKGTSEVTKLPNGTYVYRANATGTANYSANATGQTHNLTITLGAAPTATVTFDRSSPQTYATGNNLGIQCDITNGENSILQIYRNTTLVKQTTTNATQITYNDSIGVGVWNYSCYYIASQNYTAASSINNNYVVYKAVPTLVLNNNTASVNTSGLVGYWRMEEGTGQIVGDSSGYGNDGTFAYGDWAERYDPSWSSNNCRIGSCVNFNGNTTDGQVVVIPDASSLNTSGEMSADVWIYPRQYTGQGDGQYYIMAKGSYPNYGWIFELYEGGNIKLLVMDQGVDVITSTNTVPLNAWSHLAFAHKNNVTQLYINGALDKNQTTRNLVPAATRLYIGQDSADYDFNGTIDEVQIWNRSLTADEINELYESRVQYPTQTMFNATEPNSGDADVTYGLYRNTTLVTSTENGTAMRLPAGYHYYVFNATAGSNYTTASLLLPLNVTKGVLYPDTFVNGTATWSYQYPNATNVTCNITQVDGGSGPSCSLWRDDVSKGTGEVTRLPVGSYVYRANTTGTANYSANATGQTRTLTITSGAAPSVVVTFDRTSGRNYTGGNNLGIQCDVTNAETSILQIYRNGTSVKNTTSNATQLTYNDSIGVGVWNYSCYYIASQNYTAASSVNNNYVVYKAVPILVMNNNTASVNTSGLVGYWRFENESLGTAMDYSGWGNNGTLTSMNNSGNETSGPTTNGRFGNAMQFDGSNDYVSITNPTSTNNMNNFTLSAWVYPRNGYGETTPRIIDKNGYARIYIDPADGQVACDAANATDYSVFAEGSNYNIPINAWSHIACTFSGNTVSIYINGTPDNYGSTTGVGTITSRTGNVYIGDNGGTSRVFNGTIDEVQIWNRSLTADEVKELYESRVQYPTQTMFNATRSVSGGDADVTYNLYRNTTLVTSTENGTAMRLPAGYHYYIFNATAGTNYTTASLLLPVNVTKGVLYPDTFVNDTATWSYAYPTVTNVTCNLTQVDGGGGPSCSLWRDDVSKGTSEVTRLPNGTYVYRANATGTANYSANATGQTHNLTITLGAAPTVTVTFDRSSPQTYVSGNNLGIQCDITNGENSILQILRNNTVVKQTTSNATQLTYNDSIGVGVWNYSCYYIASQNYTAASSIDNNYVVYKNVPILTMSNNTATVNTSGLVGYWRFENESLGTAADYSGWGNNGTLTSMNNTGNATSGPTANGRFGNAMQFDGVNDYVNAGTGTSLDITGAITIEAWIKPNYEVASRTGQIFQRHSWNSCGYRVEIDQKNGVIDFYTFQSGANQDTGSSGVLNFGQWNHVVVVRSGTTATIYVNGEDRTSYHGSHIDPTGCAAANPATISSNWAPETFNGTIDEVQIWNRSLTADEINELYESRVQYPTQTMMNATESNSGDADVTYGLYRNTTLVTSTENGTAFRLPAGYHYYVFNATAGTNYTTASLLLPLNITKGVVYPDTFVNSTATWSYAYPNATNVTCNITQVDGGSGPSCSLWRDDVSKGTSEVTRLPVGSYVYRANTTGTANYSANATGQTRTLTITSGAAPTATVTFDRSSPQTYATGNNLGIQCDITNGENSILQIYRNTTLVKQTTTNATQVTYNDSIGVGVWNYSCYYIASQNFSAATSINNNFVVNQAAQATTLQLNGTSADKSYVTGQIAEIKAFSNVSTMVTTIYANFTGSLQNITPPAAGTVTNYTNTANLAIGPYLVRANTTGNENYTSSTSDSYILTTRQVQVTATCEAGGPYTTAGSIIVIGNVTDAAGTTLASSVTVDILKNSVLQTSGSTTSGADGGYYKEFSPLSAGNYVANVTANYQGSLGYCSDTFVVASAIACTEKTIGLSGYAFDYSTGQVISSGTVKVTIKETGDDKERSFSNGYWSVSFTSCFTAGNRYTAAVKITDSSTGKASYSQLEFVAK